MGFRESRFARQVSLILLFSFLLEIVSPAFALPPWDAAPDYPLASSKRHTRKPGRRSSDPALQKVLDRARGAASQLPEFRGERPMDAAGSDSAPSGRQTPTDLQSPTATDGQITTAASSDAPEQTATGQAATTAEAADAPQEPDCGCGDHDSDSPDVPETGPELAAVEANPNSPFPQWQYSRQTYENGPYLAINDEIPAVQAQDRLFHVARKLNNPGAVEEYTVDVFSPVSQNNATARGSTASCRWTYRRVSGTSASSFDARYELEVRVWDRGSPSGRVVARREEAMWLPQLPFHCAFALHDVGNHLMVSQRNEEAPTQTTVQVNFPQPEVEGLSHRVFYQDRPLDQSPVIAYTSDERVNDVRTYEIPQPDESGNQQFKARLDWRSNRGGFGRTRFHSYASIEASYTSDGEHYRVERRLFDGIFRDGHLLQVETGDGRLEQLTIAGGFAMPREGRWRIQEHADGTSTITHQVMVRALSTEVAPLTASLFQGNGSSIYRMVLHASGPDRWVPEKWLWTLTLRDDGGRIIRTYTDQVEGNTEADREFYQIWDGNDEDGNKVPANTNITPDLQLVFLNEDSQNFGAWSASRTLAAVAAPETWVLSGAGGGPFEVDDDVEVLLNGARIFNDTDGVRTFIPPITFQARVGDQLRVKARDSFGICSSIEPLYIRRVSNNRTQKLSNGYIGPCDDSAHYLTFFDETYLLSDDPRDVAAAVFTSGGNSPNTTRFSCENLAWTRTASAPPPPPSARGGGGGKGTSPPPYSQSAGSGLPFAINRSFDTPGQYTAANYPGISQVAGDINALFYNHWNHPMQMGFFSPIPILIAKGSGRFNHAFADLVVYSRTAPLYLGRSYASEQQADPHGFGWSWSFDESLVVFRNQVLFKLPDGGAVLYQDDGEGYQPTMSHITTKLTRVDERTFRFDYKGGGSSTYQIPAGLTVDFERPVLARPVKSTDTNGFSNTFTWDARGQRLLKMQGPDRSQFIELHWSRDCEAPQLLYACDSAGRWVRYRYKKFRSPAGQQDELLAEVVQTGCRTMQFRYHPVLGHREYDLLDIVQNGTLQEKVVSNPASPGQLLEVTHRPKKTMTFKREVDPDTGEIWTTFTQSSPTHDTPQGEDQSIRYQVDAKDRVISVRDALGNQIFYEWDENYNLTRVSDLQGHALAMTYDERRNLLSTSDILGRTQTMEYDSDDNLTATVDALGRRQSMTWDHKHRLLSITDAQQHTTTMTYDGFGSLISVTDPLGHRTTMDYDARGFLKSIQAPDLPGQPASRYTVIRNANGEVVKGVDALGRTVKMERDEWGRVTEAILPAVTARYRQECLPEARSRVCFDRNDLLESMTAVDGRVTQYRYDAAQRLVEVQEAGYPAPTRLTYDAFDNLKTLTRPNGATTTYTYDRLNRLVSIQYPGGDDESLVYDARGNVKEWHRGNLVVFYEYDPVDRLIHVSCPSTGDDYRYTLDAADRMLALQDQTGVTNYEYTPVDLLQRVTHPGNRAISYQYDAANRLLQTTDPESETTRYEYDARDQLVSARRGSLSVAYRHDVVGRTTSFDYSNGVTCQQAFDERDRLLYRHYQKPGTPLLTLKYAFNQLGQRVLDDRTMSNGNQLTRYSYNRRLELVRSVRQRGAVCEQHSYEYDLNHNMTSKDGVDFTNNLADQLLQVQGQGSLSYSAAGQAVSALNSQYTYNCRDQITAIQMPGKSIAYQYDGAGQRVQKSVNGVVSKFLWNGNEVAKEYTSDGTVRADYFLAPQRTAIRSGGKWYFYLSDIQGSTLMLTDERGNAAATYDYSDYGETRQTSGPNSLYNPYLYTGQERDSETGLYHLRARHYSPAFSRFLARDPIGVGGGSNMYAYCSADPVNYSDPTGLFTDAIAVVTGTLTPSGLNLQARMGLIIVLDEVNFLMATLSVYAVYNDGRPDKRIWVKAYTDDVFADSYSSNAVINLPIQNPAVDYRDYCGAVALKVKLEGYYHNILMTPAVILPSEFTVRLTPTKN